MYERLDPNTGNRIFTLPEEGWADAIIHKQGEIQKDALLLSGIYVRTMLEDFSNQGGLDVPIYDYGGQPAGTVKLRDVFHTLEHHRYCVVNDGFVHDIFSRQGSLGSEDHTGTKLKVDEVLNAVLEFVSRIKVRDFVGVLRGMLERLSIHSSRHDAIAAVQNVHSIAQIIRERAAANGTPSEFATFFADQLTEDEQRILDLMCANTGDSFSWTQTFGLPRFKIGDRLGERKLTVTIMKNGKDETFAFGWDELFRKFVKVHGDEPLVPREVLGRRFAHSSGLE